MAEARSLGPCFTEPSVLTRCGCRGCHGRHRVRQTREMCTGCHRMTGPASSGVCIRRMNDSTVAAIHDLHVKQVASMLVDLIERIDDRQAKSQAAEQCGNAANTRRSHVVEGSGLTAKVV